MPQDGKQRPDGIQDIYLIQSFAPAADSSRHLVQFPLLCRAQVPVHGLEI